MNSSDFSNFEVGDSSSSSGPSVTLTPSATTPLDPQGKVDPTNRVIWRVYCNNNIISVDRLTVSEFISLAMAYFAQNSVYPSWKQYNTPEEADAFVANNPNLCTNPPVNPPNPGKKYAWNCAAITANPIVAGQELDIDAAIPGGTVFVSASQDAAVAANNAADWKNRNTQFKVLDLNAGTTTTGLSVCDPGVCYCDDARQVIMAGVAANLQGGDYRIKRFGNTNCEPVPVGCVCDIAQFYANQSDCDGNIPYIPPEVDIPTPTPTPTLTPTNTSTRTPTPTVTRTVTPGLSPTRTPTLTPTTTPGPTVTPTVTVTSGLAPTVTPTNTTTPGSTTTPTLTITPTVTLTVTPGLSPTVTNTMTRTPTPTVTVTISPTVTMTRTQTLTPTSSKQPTPTPTLTKTQTQTPVDSMLFAYPECRPGYPTPTPTISPTKVISPGPPYNPDPCVGTMATLTDFPSQYVRTEYGPAYSTPIDIQILSDSNANFRHVERGEKLQCTVISNADSPIVWDIVVNAYISFPQIHVQPVSSIGPYVTTTIYDVGKYITDLATQNLTSSSMWIKLTTIYANDACDAYDQLYEYTRRVRFVSDGSSYPIGTGEIMYYPPRVWPFNDIIGGPGDGTTCSNGRKIIRMVPC